MSTKAAAKDGTESTVLVIGGSGGLSNRYRDVVESRGCSLRHFEHRVPAGVRRNAGKVALIVIMVGMVSHALRDQAEQLREGDTPVVYLRSASASALDAALEQWVSPAARRAA